MNSYLRIEMWGSGLEAALLFDIGGIGWWASGFEG
jgi:hypothetical protein